MNSTIVGDGAALFDLIGYETGQTYTLLYRGSRDGYLGTTFQGIVNGITNTLTIIQSSNGYIFGGFADIPWDATGTGNYGTSNQTFIFTLTNPQSTSIVIPVDASGAYALELYSNAGATFGGPGSSDIYVSDSADINSNSHTNVGCAYPLSGYTCGTTTAQNYFTGSFAFMALEIETYESNIFVSGNGVTPAPTTTTPTTTTPTTTTPTTTTSTSTTTATTSTTGPIVATTTIPGKA